ncbi:GDP-mannose 4,6-dehydratase [Candidatus Dependentiae bacterium]|nr:GDP-mannose 4,6-dehydratase [Candidatus Dependentiae bacterium]
MVKVQVGNESKFWKNKNILVTGAGGFVGSNLCKHFFELGANVVGMVRDLDEIKNLKLFNIDSKINIVIGNLVDKEFLYRVLQKYNINSVYHLAAQVVVSIANEGPLSTFESNIRGTYMLLEAIRIYGKVKRVVIASSDKSYGIHKKLPYKEDFPLQPHFPYDVSKASADMIAKSYFYAYKMPIVITRFANIFGPGQLHFSAIIPDTMMSILNNNDPVIRSDGTPERDFLYVKDVVRIYEILGRNLQNKKLHGEVFNAGHGKPIKILDLVNTILKVIKSDLKPVIKGKHKPKLEIDRQYLDSTKIKKVLGYKHKYSIAEGLLETYKWYKENFKKLNKKYQGKHR